MHEKPLLSFIIPVYNVEKYLNECLDSIFDPSIDEAEYEVIAVDDGSTDSSPEILKTYLHHSNFRIITQKNSGQGAARNVGIKVAQGNYIHFIDSDDYLVPGAVPALLGWARQSDSDIIEFNNQAVDNEGNIIDELTSQINRMPSEGNGKDVFVAWSRQAAFFDILCIRLCKREFIINNSLFFITDVLYEDTEWRFRCFFWAKKVVYHPVIIYIYRRWDGSSTTEKNIIKRYRCNLKILDAMASFRKTINISNNNLEYLALQGDYIVSQLERVNNALFKSPDLRNHREELFSELKERRYMFSFAAKQRERLLYLLTRWMPAKVAFIIYKIS